MHVFAFLVQGIYFLKSQAVTIDWVEAPERDQTEHPAPTPKPQPVVVLKIITTSANFLVATLGNELLILST